MRTVSPPELRVCDPQKVKKGVQPYIVYRVIVNSFLFHQIIIGVNASWKVGYHPQVF